MTREKNLTRIQAWIKLKKNVEVGTSYHWTRRYQSTQQEQVVDEIESLQTRCVQALNSGYKEIKQKYNLD